MGRNNFSLIIRLWNIGHGLFSAGQRRLWCDLFLDTFCKLNRSMSLFGVNIHKVPQLFWFYYPYLLLHCCVARPWDDMSAMKRFNIETPVWYFICGNSVILSRKGILSFNGFSRVNWMSLDIVVIRFNNYSCFNFDTKYHLYGTK